MSTQSLTATDSQTAIGWEANPSTEERECLICRSAGMRKLLDRISIIGPHLRVATIEGESGTGKHAVARLLHRRYISSHPEIGKCEFMRCDAREWLLLQSSARPVAGFLFLDRVDLLAAPGQALLLRTLKDIDFRQCDPVVFLGSSESSLRELARKGEFLTPLALRLTAVRFAVPPLRDRDDDLVSLANMFLDRLAARYRLPPIVLTPEAIARLFEYSWPGNLHELSSVLESAVIECSNGVIRGEELGLPVSRIPAPTRAPAPELLNLDAVIQSHVLHVLDSNHGNKVRTARQLGISRSTLYRLIEKKLSFSA